VNAADLEDDRILGELLDRAERDGDWAQVPQFGSLAGARQYRRLLRMARRHLPAGARVLDWGTGAGHFSYFLTRVGHRATGYAIEGVSSAAWLGEPYERFVGGTPAEPVRLPFADREFDAVASIGVLEHVRETGGDESASLVEIARVMRPGGVFLCYHFPNRSSWIDFAASLVPGKHHHRYRYARADVERLVGTAGLELLEFARYGFLPRNALRRLPRGLRRSRAFADLWDGADAVLGALLGPLSQNLAFVARRPERRGA
jgi:ubiquinone/menaquinone biosynthesis C-methylase UbiE